MKNSYYFPHDYHARHDPKLEKLRMEIGPVGDGVFWDLVEMLYEEGGYLPKKDIPIFAKMLNTTAEIVERVVSEIFLTKNGKFYNKSLLDRLTHINNVREGRALAGEISGKARQTNKCSTNVQHVLNNIKESKVKESKVKEIKEGAFFFLNDKNFTDVFTSYLKTRKKKATDHAKELILKNLHKYSKEVAIAMLEQSIMNGWQGVFELKTKSNLTRAQQASVASMHKLEKEWAENGQ